MPDSETKKVGLYLPINIYEKVKEISDQFGFTINGFIKSIIQDYLIDKNYIK